MIQAKPYIKQLKPYTNADSLSETFKNRKKIIKLDSNETTISPSPKVTAAILQYLQNGNLQWYPDVEARELTAALSHYVALPKSHILTFNGSDHALETICRAFLSAGDVVLHAQPTYDHFRVYAQSCGAVMVPMTELDDQSLSDKIAVAKNCDTRLVYLANPNNPTGHLWSYNDIALAVKTNPDLLFIIDEAYYEFSRHSVVDLVTEFQNIVVTRSFSKAFGLASLRCGYLIAHPAITEQIAKIRVGKSLNALAQHAAVAALQDLNYTKRYIEEVIEVRDWLVASFQAHLVKVTNTPANFVLIQVARPHDVVQFLRENNIFVRNRSHLPGLAGYIRVTVGDKLTMKRFWKVFETIPGDWLSSDEITSPRTQSHFSESSPNPLAPSARDI